MYKTTHIEREVFRAYDIRGIVGEQLDENAFYSIGKAVSCCLRKLNRAEIIVARDGRLTSATLINALVQGLVDSGITVTDLGAVTTPMMYYATHTLGIDSGLMVTGSHNPSQYNGIKMVLAGTTLADAEIQNIYELVMAREFLQGAGSVQKTDITEHYIKRIISDIKLQRPLKVAIDCGNGIAGPTVMRVLRELGCQIIPLYCDVDGNFPNHHPDPSVAENLRDLQKAVADNNADIGLAFDGDGDRLGVITDSGEVIWPDRLMMMYAQDELQNNPGATIVYDVKCSSHLSRVIAQAGGVPHMCPTGHSIVKRVMKQTQAALAGEMSGHIFFKSRWYGFDDATYSACRLLEIVSKSLKNVSVQFATIPNSVNTPEIKIPIVEHAKFAFMQRFSTEANFSDADLIAIDGLRVEFAHGWGLVRASNTTPCLVARFEAEDQITLEVIQALFKTQLQAIDNTLAIPF